MFWIFLFAGMLIFCIIGILYLSWIIGKFKLIRRISKDKSKIRRFISFISVMALYCLFTIFISMIDATVIILHLMLIAALYGIIIRVAEKISKRSFKINWRGHLTFITTIVYLSIAYFLCNNVWRTQYDIKTDKLKENVKIALITDSHLSTTLDGDEFEKYLNDIACEKPDIILISGDFVDDSTKKTDMVKACQALGKMNPELGIYFVYGNHDKGYYNSRDFTVEELKENLEKNNVRVLEDETVELEGLIIVGRKDASDENRKSIEDLLKNLDKEKYIIVLDHQPNDFSNEAKAGADLVLSGHTHGGQLLPITYFGELTGMNDKTYGYERRDNTDFIVSSGISDWAIHFKSGTKSEYVIIDLQNTGKIDH